MKGNNIGEMLAVILAASFVLIAAMALLLQGDVPALPAMAAVMPAPLVEIAYSPERDLEVIDVRLIASAEHTIDMDAYVLTDGAVVNALIEAGRRGVKVRVWREASEPENEAVRGLDLRYKPAGELMHLKSYCVDGKVLRTGAANFSRSGETRQDNDLIILRIPGACNQFEAKFEKAWEVGK